MDSSTKQQQGVALVVGVVALLIVIFAGAAVSGKAEGRSTTEDARPAHPARPDGVCCTPSRASVAAPAALAVAAQPAAAPSAAAPLVAPPRVDGWAVPLVPLPTDRRPAAPDLTEQDFQQLKELERLKNKYSH